jgi:hypothetical protein
MLWDEGSSGFLAFDDNTVYGESGLSMHKVVTLSATPSENVNGVADPQCSGYGYITDDGFVARDGPDGSNHWKSRVDPSQGAGNGTRALYSAVLPGCDIVAGDDHGFITRLHDDGNTPHVAWSHRYGYAAASGAGPDAAYPISGVALTSQVVLATSSYDPHLDGFDASSGKLDYSYALPSNTQFLVTLADHVVLAIGVTGDLSPLVIP